eukprot:1015523-Amorphochlora_amoeboformis.AAC.1
MQQLIAAMLPMGAILGSLCGGTFADKYGRNAASLFASVIPTPKYIRWTGLIGHTNMRRFSSCAGPLCWVCRSSISSLSHLFSLGVG